MNRTLPTKPSNVYLEYFKPNAKYTIENVGPLKNIFLILNYARDGVYKLQSSELISVLVVKSMFHSHEW